MILLNEVYVKLYHATKKRGVCGARFGVDLNM